MLKNRYSFLILIILSIFLIYTTTGCIDAVVFYNYKTNYVDKVYAISEDKEVLMNYFEEMNGEKDNNTEFIDFKNGKYGIKMDVEELDDVNKNIIVEKSRRQIKITYYLDKFFDFDNEEMQGMLGDYDNEGFCTGMLNYPKKVSKVILYINGVQFEEYRIKDRDINGKYFRFPWNLLYRIYDKGKGVYVSMLCNNVIIKN